jgi:hypothetical protein
VDPIVGADVAGEALGLPDDLGVLSDLGGVDELGVGDLVGSGFFCAQRSAAVASSCTVARAPARLLASMVARTRSW